MEDTFCNSKQTSANASRKKLPPSSVHWASHMKCFRPKGSLRDGRIDESNRTSEIFCHREAASPRTKFARRHFCSCLSCGREENCAGAQRAAFSGIHSAG